MEEINISYGVQVLRPDAEAAENPRLQWTRISKPFPFFTAQILTCRGRGDSGEIQ